MQVRLLSTTELDSLELPVLLAADRGAWRIGNGDAQQAKWVVEVNQCTWIVSIPANQRRHDAILAAWAHIDRIEGAPEGRPRFAMRIGHLDLRTGQIGCYIHAGDDYSISPNYQYCSALHDWMACTGWVFEPFPESEALGKFVRKVSLQATPEEVS